MTLAEGKKAPNFSLFSASGDNVRLSQLKGQPVVVYFYPKDDTSGCTLEAKDFSLAQKTFKKAGAHVLGISPDTIESHKKFAAKHNLTVELLADPEKSAAKSYEVWVEKSMYGRKYMGIERATFLIDKQGKIARIWQKVRVKGHVDEVLAALKELTTSKK